MKGFAQKLLIGTSAFIGMTAMASAPALAGSLTGASISPTEPHLIYDTVACGISTSGTCTELSNTATAQEVLDNLGNVELSGSTSTSGAADFTNATTLSGTVDGSAITFMSLTAKDWFGADEATAYGNDDFANTWFDAALDAYSITNAGLANAVYNATLAATGGDTTAATIAAASAPTSESLFNRFLADGGFERFSDPNIASVEGDGNGGLEVVLAGHFDGTEQFFSYLTSEEMAVVSTILSGQPLQISEVVKVTYNGEVSYQYGFSATSSDVVEISDEVSHDGNYTLSQVYSVDEPEGVPEPSTILGLMAIGGLVAASKRKSEKA
ncbi:MAG: NF038130 family PEP-CTERM protein [Cyanobacteria bacterium SBLK]|nr:NF038130 family PEP-CTERM protein [Cyanobacteria bacterium SBLK]